LPASRPARYGLKSAWLCFAAASAILIAAFGPALAASDAALCDRAALAAAQRHNVPPDVLRTVALLETGRKQGGAMRPWPWALNAGGQSHWLPDKSGAKATARALLDSGRRNLDFGCFQLNYRWHGENFASLDDMLDPAQNADYAARYLRSHYQRLGDWKEAVGAYHSRNPDHAKRYLARYEGYARQLLPAADLAVNPLAHPTATRPAQTGFALLTGPGAGSRGSLVPASILGGARPLIQLGKTAK